MVPRPAEDWHTKTSPLQSARKRRCLHRSPERRDRSLSLNRIHCLNFRNRRILIRPSRFHLIPNRLIRTQSPRIPIQSHPILMQIRRILIRFRNWFHLSCACCWSRNH